MMRWHYRLAGMAISRIAGASLLYPLMVVRKIFLIANAWITSSRASIQTSLNHSLLSISESPVLEETGKAVPFQRKRGKSQGSKAAYGGHCFC